MIIINTVNISEGGLKLNVNVSTGIGFNITSVLLWTDETFKDYSKAKNLDFKLEQVNNSEIFIIEPEEVNLTKFDGIYFLEFKTDEPDPGECETCPGTALAVVTNLDQYYRCMSEFILKSDICNTNLFSREVCDDGPVNKAITVNLLIEAINQSLELGQLIEAIDMLKNIKKLCNKCTNCKSIIKTSSCSSCNTYTY